MDRSRSGRLGLSLFFAVCAGLAASRVEGAPEEQDGALSGTISRERFLELEERARRGGADAIPAVHEAVAQGGMAGIRFAEEVLSWGNPTLAQSVIFGLAQHERPEAEGVLLRAAYRFRGADQRRDTAEAAWAWHFVRRAGAGAAEAAKRELAVENLDPVARGLLVRVFADDRIDRAEALPAYRPYLRDPAPDVRRNALAVNAALYDAEPLPILLELENESVPEIRNVAHWLCKRYLRFGDNRRLPGEGLREHLARIKEPADPAGFAAWLSREEEWGKEQQRLLEAQPGYVAPAVEIDDPAGTATQVRSKEGALAR